MFFLQIEIHCLKAIHTTDNRVYVKLFHIQNVFLNDTCFYIYHKMSRFRKFFLSKFYVMLDRY
jgi:hypothetical protein